MRGTESDTIESDGARAAAQAARALVRDIPSDIKARLYEEHGTLVEKQFVDELTHKEFVRLRYLRWQIDRIQDSEVGADLDGLEDLIALHERISRDVASFADHAQSVASHTARPKGRHR